MEDKKTKKFSKLEIAIFGIYIGLFIIIGMTLLIYQPPTAVGNLTNPPDEFSRFMVPRFIFERGILPTANDEEVRIPGYGNSYALFPVVAYVFQAIGMRILSIFNNDADKLIYYARAVNLSFGVITQVMIYLVSRELFQKRAFRWFFCFFIMFLPQHLFIFTYVNTDAMSSMACSIISLALVYIYKKKINLKFSVLLSLGCALCILSYYSAYGYVLMAVLLCIIYFIQSKDGKISYDYKNALKWAVIISAMVVILSAWFFIRNAILYGGDFLGLETSRLMRIGYGAPEVNPELHPSFKEMGYSYPKFLWMIATNHFLLKMIKSYICCYGSMIIEADPFTYGFYLVTYFVGLVGYVIRSVKRLKNKESDLKKILINAVLILGSLIPVFLITYYAYSSDYQWQGRYILSAVIPLSFFVTRGICYLLNKTKMKEKYINIIMGLMSATCVICEIIVVYVMSLYRYLEPGAFYYLV